MNQEAIQYLTDAVGDKKAVIIPIEDWQQLMEWYSQTEEYQTTKRRLYESFKEIEQMEKGEASLRTLDDLFDEIEEEDED